MAAVNRRQNRRQAIRYDIREQGRRGDGDGDGNCMGRGVPLPSRLGGLGVDPGALGVLTPPENM